ncbi:MAG: glycosyltransferase [Ostreibacterium sp.]
MKKKILLLSYSRSSYGYIVPLVIMARTLQSLQYEVHFACHESQMYIPESFSINNTHAIFEKEPFSHQFNLNTTWGYYRAIATGFGSPDYLSRTIADEQRLLCNIVPDMVFFNMRFTLGKFAYNMGIPTISVHNPSIFKNYPLFLPVLIRLWRQYGLPIEHVFGDNILIPDFANFYDNKNITLDNCDVDKSVFYSVKQIIFAGHALMNMTCHEPKESIRKRLFNNKLPFLFINLGGSKQVAKTLLYVAKYIDINANYLFVTGDNFDKNDAVFQQYILALKNKTTGQVQIETYVSNPQTYMQAANLAFIHGGLSTTMEAMISATPVIGFPASQEQNNNLQRIINAGSGVIFNPDETEALHHVTTNMLIDSQWQDSAFTVQKKLMEDDIFDVAEFVNQHIKL